jgi:hypothetical protein
VSDRRRAYRYEVIETTGEGTSAMDGKPNILDWKYLGKEYTWTIVGGPRFEVHGTITGRYIDKGYCEDGKFRTDAEIAEAVA